MPDATAERPKRLTLSQIVGLLLTRGAGERSAVALTRNASGETQIEVSIRTGDDGAIVTAEDAERKAVEVYERLRQKYPQRNGHDNADVSLTRNARGETQVSISVKTSEEIRTVERAAAEARKVYDNLRGKYPMVDGYTAKPGSVA